jgi:hypothetical protein
VCRVRRTSGEGLEAYERMVLDHVAGLAVDGVVPTEALTTGPQDQSTRWWRAFQHAVVGDARGRGLARDRWSGSAKAFLRAAALVPAGLGVLYANAAAGLDFGTIGAGLVIWVALTSSIKLFGDQRDTPAGAEAAARWLGVRNYLGATRCSRPCRRCRWPSGTGIWATAPPWGWPRRRCMPCRWGPRTIIGPGPPLADVGGW